MRPQLPTAAALQPYLERIDAQRWYTNFGPLHDAFLLRLLADQAQRQAAGQALAGALVSSATLGLELALTTLDLPLGSPVAVPALTFPATATAVLRAGHRPVVLDVEPDHWMLSPAGLDAALAAGVRVAAAMPVATFGMPHDVQAWSAWSRASGCPVVVDAAAAWGAQACAPGVDAVFSLHATKSLSCGEGGLVLTLDPERAQRLRAMSNFGIGSTRPTAGTNAKLSEFHAAVGLAHLDGWPAQVAQRRAVWNHYAQALKPWVERGAVQWQRDTGLWAPSVLALRFPPDGSRSSVRDRVERALGEAGIQTRRWYQPLLPRQPMLPPLDTPLPLVHAEALEASVLGLPFFPDLSADAIDRIVGIIAKTLATGAP